MKKNISILLSFFLFVSAASAYQKLSTAIEEKHALTDSFQLTDIRKTICKQIFPQADTFLESETSPPFFYAIHDTTSMGQFTLGYVLFTEDFALDIRGFAGPIKMALGISRDNKIIKTIVLSHMETPAYTANIDEYIEQFQNQNIDTTFDLKTNIDGMTRATMTSQAVVDTINRTNHLFIGLNKQKKIKSNIPESRDLPLSQVIIPVLLFLFGILSLYFPQINLRWKIMFVSFLYLGIAKATMLSTTQIVNFTLGACFPFLQNPIFYILLGATLITSICWGNIYCSSICPFAAVEETLHAVFAKLTKPLQKIPSVIFRKARMIKYIFLFLLVFIGIILKDANVINVEVFVLLFSRNFTWIGGIFIGLILLFSFFYERFWCRFLCPIGALNGLIGSLSLHKIRAKKETCTQCQKCVKICPMDALELKNKNLLIEHSQCILCGRCLKVCSENSLEYK